MKQRIAALALLLVAGCGSAASSGADAARGADAGSDAGVTEPDAPVVADVPAADDVAVDAQEPVEDVAVPPMDAPVGPDAEAPPDAPAEDAAAPADAPTAGDAVAEAGSTALCPVRALNELYPGFLPTNPYSAQPAATPCVSAPHDVIMVLGCPNNADGSPATCQTRRADMAAAMYRAGLASWFITSGAAAHNAYVEADTLAQLLVARGVPNDHIVREPRALHTDENIYYSSRIMQERGWSTALVVSEDPGHLIMSAVCDANCCVNLGRLTVFAFSVGGSAMVAGHYVLSPPGTNATTAECAQIQQPIKLMCTNLSSRNACAGRIRL